MSEWIPCEKEMPNEYGLYLVTTKLGRVKIDRYYPDSNIWGINTRYGYGKAEYRAWMPLPKPWEGADNEHDK